MARAKSTLLTDREAEIMTALWDLGTASADDVRGRLSGNPHDSTVRTLLRVLVSKGQVAPLSDSRPTLYRPVVKRQSVQKKVTRDLLKRFFRGSAAELMLHLIDDERLTPEQLKGLEAAFRRRKDKEK